MLRLLWASKDFKLVLLSSILNAGLMLVFWYSIRMDFLLGLGLWAGIFPPAQLALKILLEHHLKTRDASKLISALLTGLAELTLTSVGFYAALFLTFPKAVQAIEIVAFIFGIGFVFGVAQFWGKWKELKRQAISKPTTPPSPPVQ